MVTTITILTILSPLVELLLRAGAKRVLLVGGAVVDIIRGIPSKDFDVEVYGLPYASIVEVLRNAGWRADLVGASFGIVKTILPSGDEVDLSVPRRDNKVGVGHKGFTVTLDADLDPREAARRRDLTFNALAVDLKTGEVLDFCGGLDDLRKGILRATDPETFVEDPLRVLRIMQLLPRKGKVVAPETVELCRSIVSEFTTLPGERVEGEFRKLLLKAPRPSEGLRFLEECGWLECFPELAALKRTPQNPAHHPEGSVWEHTLLVVDRAKELKELLPEEWRYPFMLAALLHDVGKPVVTDPATLRAHGHDTAGVPIAEGFLRRLRLSNEVVKRVCVLVETHMIPGHLVRSGASESAWRRLGRKVDLHVLGLLAQADSQGRGGDYRSRPAPEAEICRFYADKFAQEPVEPLVKGRDLISAGFKPGPHFKVALEAAFEEQLKGCFDKGHLLRVAVEALRAA